MMKIMKIVSVAGGAAALTMKATPASEARSECVYATARWRRARAAEKQTPTPQYVVIAKMLLKMPEYRRQDFLANEKPYTTEAYRGYLQQYEEELEQQVQVQLKRLDREREAGRRDVSRAEDAIGLRLRARVEAAGGYEAWEEREIEQQAWEEREQQLAEQK